ncbi:MAG: InlB B-repeat-containing protein [Bacteroidaceae bacterium]|nr:InlB B-repeat-containing protein [Bacteroidaceae bacterium]
MNTHTPLFRLLLIYLTLLCSISMRSEEITYRLERVNSVREGRYYVMEQGGYVMANTIVNSALQTTSDYASSSLTGTEPYVWELESSASGYLLRNCSLATNAYLKNSSSTTLTLTAQRNQPTVWTFSFDEQGVAHITSTAGRYLGYTNTTDHAYKAYSAGGYASDITVYELIEEQEVVSHTASFSINAKVDNALSQKVVEGQSIPFPADPRVEGVTFRGWMRSPIAGNQNEAPKMVSPTEERMGTDDVTYYAVFALADNNSGGQAELTDEEIVEHFTSEYGQAYADAERMWQDDQVLWGARCTSNKGGNFLQIRKNDIPSYIRIEAPSHILQVSFTVGSATTGKEFAGTIYLVTEPTANSSANAVGSCSQFREGEGQIVPSEPHSVLYLQASSAARISHISLLWGETVGYSHYCTTVDGTQTEIQSPQLAKALPLRYDLQGRRVSQRSRGLYIEGGAKHLN